ncbi:uncharacterized protein K452DRAFT_345045 [Aplosporella prunicola CBS 121167]|uniref:Uncharacterized protein n=1 Tax=Aplosporella prunicola CBS 121167 TaxID=1176127 RepID=A0A6A6AWJ3_9PEZI|nr:uncharacterized protein K452DRAFT_345045 [Aplosporella prunicola CBS 121167]KAF2136090.1 hypothetical protein K452DRAFT_345045 [Aplosporella prunicola CBS 121167]
MARWMVVSSSSSPSSLVIACTRYRIFVLVVGALKTYTSPGINPIFSINRCSSVTGTVALNKTMCASTLVNLCNF